MSRSIILLGLASVLGACQTTAPTSIVPPRASPRSTCRSSPAPTMRSTCRRPTARLSPSEAARLDGWFRSMVLGYGDTIYVDGATGYGARDDVARVAGQYGMLVALGAPMTAGPVPPGHGPRGRRPDQRLGPRLPQLVEGRDAQFRQCVDVELRLRREQQHGGDGRQSRRTWCPAAKAAASVTRPPPAKAVASISQGGSDRPRRPQGHQHEGQ